MSNNSRSREEQHCKCSHALRAASTACHSWTCLQLILRPHWPMPQARCKRRCLTLHTFCCTMRKKGEGFMHKERPLQSPSNMPSVDRLWEGTKFQGLQTSAAGIIAFKEQCQDDAPTVSLREFGGRALVHSGLPGPIRPRQQSARSLRWLLGASSGTKGLPGRNHDAKT